MTTATTLSLDGRCVAFNDRPGPQSQAAAAPLLLIHGYTGAKDDFDPVLDDLARDRRVVAVDLPGHGDSAGPDDPRAYGLWALADWVRRFAAAAELGRHHLLGHSMGGLVVQRVAARGTQALASLVLMGTGLGRLRPEALEQIERVAAVGRARGLEAAFEESMQAMEDGPVDPGAVAARKAREAALRRRFLRLHPEALHVGARNLADAEPLTSLPVRWGLPVLVVHGDADHAWTPAEQALLAEAIPGARRGIIPASYHSPQQENPEAWLTEVRAFLEDADCDQITGGVH